MGNPQFIKTNEHSVSLPPIVETPIEVVADVAPESATPVVSTPAEVPMTATDTVSVEPTPVEVPLTQSAVPPKTSAK